MPNLALQRTSAAVALPGIIKVIGRRPGPLSFVVERNLTVDLFAACSLPARDGSFPMLRTANASLSPEGVPSATASPP